MNITAKYKIINKSGRNLRKIEYQARKSNSKHVYLLYGWWEINSKFWKCVSKYTGAVINFTAW